MAFCGRGLPSKPWAFPRPGRFKKRAFNKPDSQGSWARISSRLKKKKKKRYPLQLQQHSFDWFASWSKTMFDEVATCGVQISRKRRKTLLFSFHRGVYRREGRHKIGSRVAFLSRSLCAARISASSTEALLTFPVPWRLNHTRIERTCRRRWEWVNDVFCWTRKRQSFQQSHERWNNGIDCMWVMVWHEILDQWPSNTLS